jgi:hypothetical protein
VSAKGSWIGCLLWAAGALAILAVGAQVIVSFWLRSVEQKRTAAERNLAMDNLRLIGLGMTMYESKNGRYPLAAVFDRNGKPLLSWRVAILPYVGEESLYREFHLDEPWDSEHNSKLIERIPSTYESPGIGPIKKGMTCILAPVGEEVAFFRRYARSSVTFAGSWSKTIFLVEAVPASSVIIRRWQYATDTPGYSERRRQRPVHDCWRKTHSAGFRHRAVDRGRSVRAKKCTLEGLLSGCGDRPYRRDRDDCFATRVQPLFLRDSCFVIPSTFVIRLSSFHITPSPTPARGGS